MNAPIQLGLLCYNENAKQEQTRSAKRFFRAALRHLPISFSQTLHFNRGGIAVWGETYCKLYLEGKPVVEAYDTSMGILVRQWDGRNSGHNNYVQSLEGFVRMVEQLASRPFVRF